MLNACDPDFRTLAQAALVTGARYGELAALRAADFNPDSGTVHVRTSKSGKGRHIVLNDEGAALFKSLAAGRPGDALLLVKADKSQWGKSHQARPMADACDRAKIKPAASFHILRHTWASLAVMAGAPLMVVARNLGHADTHGRAPLRPPSPVLHRGRHPGGGAEIRHRARSKSGYTRYDIVKTSKWQMGFNPTRPVPHRPSAAVIMRSASGGAMAPIISVSERKAASLMTWTMLVAHVRAVEQCDEREARRQIGNAIADGRLFARWADKPTIPPVPGSEFSYIMPRPTMRILAPDDAPPLEATYWLECMINSTCPDRVLELPIWVNVHTGEALDKGRGSGSQYFDGIMFSIFGRLRAGQQSQKRAIARTEIDKVCIARRGRRAIRGTDQDLSKRSPSASYSRRRLRLGERKLDGPE